jgi:hypothetical protein
VGQAEEPKMLPEAGELVGSAVVAVAAERTLTSSTATDGAHKDAGAGPATPSVGRGSLKAPYAANQSFEQLDDCLNAVSDSECCGNKLNSFGG